MLSLLLTISAIGRIELQSGAVFLITLLAYCELANYAMAAILLAGLPFALNAAVSFAVISHRLAMDSQAEGPRLEWDSRLSQLHSLNTRDLPLPLSREDSLLPQYETRDLYA